MTQDSVTSQTQITRWWVVDNSVQTSVISIFNSAESGLGYLPYLLFLYLLELTDMILTIIQLY